MASAAACSAARLLRAVPALRLETFDLHLDGEARRVVRPLAGDSRDSAAAAGRGLAPIPAAPISASGAASSSSLKRACPEAMDDIARRLDSRHR